MLATHLAAAGMEPVLADLTFGSWPAALGCGARAAAFSLYIDDSTEGWSHTTDASLGSTPARTSAEVIVEAPCCTGSGGVLPLANFHSVTFTGATANGEPIGTPSLDPVGINMVDGAGNSELTCSVLPPDGDSFTCTWHRSS